MVAGLAGVDSARDACDSKPGLRHQQRGRRRTGSSAFFTLSLRHKHFQPAEDPNVCLGQKFAWNAGGIYDPYSEGSFAGPTRGTFFSPRLSERIPVFTHSEWCFLIEDRYAGKMSSVGHPRASTAFVSSGSVLKVDGGLSVQRL